MLIKKSTINGVISEKKFYKVLSLCLIVILVIGLCPYSAKYAYAKQSFEGIEILEEILIMQEGDKYELSPGGYNYVSMSGRKMKMVDDISNVKWKSSNTKVATIDKNGMVTAKKSGRCTITATWGKKKATSKIRVYNEKQFYQHIMDGEIAHEVIYMALTTNYYKNYDFIYDSHVVDTINDVNVKAAKKIKEIIASATTDDMSDFEKAMALAAWLIDNLELDEDYESKYTEKWLSGIDKEYGYIDPLLYGKSTYYGLGLLYELLLYTCGIRSEYMYGGFYYYMEDGEQELISSSNIIELDGDFYYFDIITLAKKMEYYKETGKKDYSFYDLIIPESEFTEEFINVKSMVDKEYYNRTGTHPRNSFYDLTNLKFHIIKGLGYNTEKLSYNSYYYYDFYNHTIQLVTLKDEQAKKNICPATYFSRLPIFPDSASSKYKETMKEIADFNGKVMNAVNTADEMNQKIKEGSTINQEELLELGNVINSLETEFENVKGSFKDRNAIKHIKNRIAALKVTYAEIAAK